MKKKIDKAKDRYLKQEDLFRCPLCRGCLRIQDYSLKCDNNHTFNINKKGIISFTAPLNDKIYNEELFKARQIILNSSIYEPFIEEFCKFITKDNLVIADAGCGEGTYLHKLSQLHPDNDYIGIDLAKDGLNLASDYKDISFLLADLANLPINDKSVDVLLNILSPANYKEFTRVLKDDGTLIKVVPGKDYLKELRQEAYEENQRVLDLVDQSFDIIERKRVSYTISISSTLKENLFLMTPLTHHHTNNLVGEEITIDLVILSCRKKGI